MSDFLRLPFFGELENARRILVAGAGGGFDLFCGLPLYFALRNSGKEVFLGNHSFALLGSGTGRRLAPGLVEVTAESWPEQYFPELHLARWFREARGEEIPIYAFRKMGVRPLAQAYETLVDELEVDTVLLIDGGTDSLMRGDEPGLGTPVEDLASIAAAYSLDGPNKLLACLGFGIDTFHGVCHAYFLEAVAELARSGAYLGAWSLTREMPEVRLYEEAARYVFQAMPDFPSIVSASILSAVEGQFGDYHATHRTHGSELFINPLMALYWTFRLEPVGERQLYPQELYLTDTPEQMSAVISRFRATLPQIRPWRELPM